ncbi:ATP-dependent DNA helicase pcrA [Mycobacteroides abscessus subsp. abscessus]|nr:ATP-dependent DNA helicase pcrA [Mycobacteroides abscessus subsp. abscessus]
MQQHLYTPEEIADALGRPRPTVEQSAIIASPLTPRLVVAGAGSGKTATMVDRVVWLVANGLVRADQVLGVTFTRKAAGELRERMRMRLEQLRRLDMVRTPQNEENAPVSDPSVSTYHSYANTLVANYGLRLGIEQDAQMLGSAQAWQLVAQLVEFVDPKLLPVDPPSKKSIIEGVMQLAGECSEHLIDPETIIEWCQQQIAALENIDKPGAVSERNKLVQRLHNRVFYALLVQQYSRLKKQMQVMDYGDLVALAARIAREIPQASATERDRFKVVLLDEFQDTSHAQMQLFSDLFGGTKGREEHPVMAVGDPKQSIYGFRGASDGQLFSFYSYFPTQDTTASYLTVAWRNDTAILHAANRVADPLKVQPAWVRSPHQVDVPDLVARPEPGVGQVLMGRYLTDQEEARSMVEKIAQERAHHAHRPLTEMPTMAVLCKKRAMMEPIRQACEELGVPYQIVGLGGLLDTPEVIDMVSVLRVLADPGRSDALMRLMAGARWRLGLSDLLALSDWSTHLAREREKAIREGRAENLFADLSEQERAEEEARQARETVSDITDHSSLIEALETLPKPGWTSVRGRSLTEVGLQRLQALAAEFSYLRQFMADDISSLLVEIERTILLDIELAAKPGRGNHEARRNLDAFHEVAAQYAMSAPRINATLHAGAAAFQNSDELTEDDERILRFSLTASSGSASGINGFLAWLDAAAAEESGLEMAAEEPRHDAVQILTVHASKGLEWDHVYIPGLYQGDFPLTKDARWTQNSQTVPWPLRGDKNFLPGWNPDHENLTDFKAYIGQFKEEALIHSTAEERRLAYVGITRARTLLMLGSAAWKGTASKPVQASEFWEELAEEAQLSPHHDPASDMPLMLRTLDETQIGEENPQSASLTTALWPFDPLDGPEIIQWKNEEEWDLAHDAGHSSENTSPSAGESMTTDILRDPAVSRRARLTRAAQNVLRGSAAEGDSPAVIGGEQTQLDGPSIEDWRQETELLLALLNEPTEYREFELPSHLSASQLVALKSNTEAVVSNLIRPMPQRPGIAARQGSIFHAWVESHFEHSAMLDMGNEEFADDDIDDSLDLPQLRENFLASEWANLQPWAVEFPLETPVEGISVRGRVDAIYRHIDESGHMTWELVDWKTGRVPRASEMEAKSIQLALYRLAFARLNDIPVEDVFATFFYVGAAKTVRPQHLADEESLKRLIRRACKAGQQGEASQRRKR